MRSYTTQKWLGWLVYKYKNIYKNIFIDKYEQLNIVEDFKNFLKKIEELKQYIVKFEKNGTIKNKIYLFNYVVYGNSCHSILIITHDEYIFSLNNGIQKAYT